MVIKVYNSKIAASTVVTPKSPFELLDGMITIWKMQLGIIQKICVMLEGVRE